MLNRLEVARTNMIEQSLENGWLHRRTSLESGGVTFADRDRRHHNRSRTMRIDAVEFLRASCSTCCRADS